MAIHIRTHKKPKVEAFQVQPDDWDALVEFVKRDDGRNKVWYNVDGDRYLLILADGRKYVFQSSDWLVMQSGWIGVFPDRVYREIYEVDDA